MPLHLTNENYKDHITKTTNAIIDFSAEWCDPCKKMKPFFDKAESFVEETNVDIKFFDIDVDESKKIARSYNIYFKPTLVLIKNGKVVSKKVGFMNDQNILTWINSHFDSNFDIDDLSQKGEESKSHIVTFINYIINIF